MKEEPPVIYAGECQLVHMNAKWNTNHVLRAQLTFFTYSSAIKIQLCSASSLSSKPPDAGTYSL